MSNLTTVLILRNLSRGVGCVWNMRMDDTGPSPASVTAATMQPGECGKRVRNREIEKEKRRGESWKRDRE